MKPGGRFAVKYADGLYKPMQRNSAREGVYQEDPERITYRFKEYLPEIGASVNTIRNETRGEEYDRRGYLYTPPMVELAMGNVLNLGQHITLAAGVFLDVFVKSAGA